MLLMLLLPKTSLSSSSNSQRLRWSEKSGELLMSEKIW
jgi:hypothetical protein